MYHLYDHLEKYGLVTGLDLRRIHELPAKRSEVLYGSVYDTLFKAQSSAVWKNQSVSLHDGPDCEDYSAKE